MKKAELTAGKFQQWLILLLFVCIGMISFFLIRLASIGQSETMHLLERQFHFSWWKISTGNVNDVA